MMTPEVLCLSFLLAAVGPFASANSVDSSERSIVVVTVAPRFQWSASSNRYLLVLQDSSARHEIDWILGPEERAIHPITLDTNQEYTFSFRRWAVTPEEDMLWLERIDSAGHPIYEIDECEIHGTKMELHWLPVIYGTFTPPFDTVLLNAQSTLFPNCPDVLYYGCVQGDETRGQGYVCTECTRTREFWLENRGK